MVPKQPLQHPEKEEPLAAVNVCLFLWAVGLGEEVSPGTVWEHEDAWNLNSVHSSVSVPPFAMELDKSLASGDSAKVPPLLEGSPDCLSFVRNPTHYFLL